MCKPPCYTYLIAMKITISSLLCLTLLSCEKVNFKNIRGFNGKVVVDVPNVQMPIHPINEPLSFSVSISTDFENIVNRDKIISFDKSEISYIDLDLQIRDTTGRIIEDVKDYQIIQNGTAFKGGKIRPVWNSATERYELSFRIKFLNKGYYWVGSNSSQMVLIRENFLFRDKNLTVEFNVPERQNSLQTKFSSLDDYNKKNNVVDLKEPTMGPGYFFIEVR